MEEAPELVGCSEVLARPFARLVVMVMAAHSSLEDLAETSEDLVYIVESQVEASADSFEKRLVEPPVEMFAQGIVAALPVDWPYSFQFD